MDMLYFFAVAAWVMSDNEAPKGPPAPDVPFNIGYLSIFICFFLMVMTFILFVIRHPVAEEIPAWSWIIHIGLIIGFGAGMYYGYESHVAFLHNWYSTH